MQITLLTLVNGAPNLKALGSKELLARSAFRVARAIKLVNDELETFDKTRRAIAQKYGAEEKENRFEFADKTQQDKFMDEISGLLEEKVNLEIDKINLKDLEDIKLEAYQLMNLDWLFEE